MTLTGGYLFHQRLAQLAPTYGARLEFVSVRQRPFPLGVVDAPNVLTTVENMAPDVVVIDSIAAAFLAFVHMRRPVVGMLHQPPGGIDYGPVRSSLQTMLDRRTYQHVPRLLVASDSLADELRQQFPRKDILVVPPGRDVAAEIGPPPGDLRQGRSAAFLCVGNWVERKGILDLIEGFAPIRDATLHLVGNSTVEPRYAQRVWTRLAQSDLEQRVIIHGPLPVAQVAALYANADAFVLPSLKEPYGTVYGEAMAFGLPVVGWRAGNLPYLADHEREGLIVPPGDLVGLSQAMQRLVDDVSLRARLGSAAKLRALSRPTWNDVAALFFRHLRELS